MLSWTPWSGIGGDPGCPRPAVYRFRLVSSNGRSIPIPRFLGTDPVGILVIGCTCNMDSRCEQSRSAILYCSGSSTMNLIFLQERYTGLLRLFPGCGYQYSFAEVPTAQAAKAVEERTLKAYLCRYGELPPLNSMIPNRYDPWDA